MNSMVWVTPWYREQDWPEWCRLCNFEGSHDAWLARAEAGTREQQRAGLSVARVVIEPQKFLEWRNTHRGRVAPDAERMVYAISVLDARHRASQS